MATRADGGTAILIFAKAPIPGFAKSRLVPALGEKRAARLHELMAHATVATVLASGLGSVELWCTPSPAHQSFQRYLDCDSLTLYEQPPGDLGTRLGYAHDLAFARHQRVVIIGTDCPCLTVAVLQQAAADLDLYDAVLVPAEDGGYVLIGLSRPCAEAFRAVDWSTARVCEQTVRGFARAQATYRLHHPLWDVDEAEDYERLVKLFPQFAV